MQCGWHLIGGPCLVGQRTVSLQTKGNTMSLKNRIKIVALLSSLGMAAMPAQSQDAAIDLQITVAGIGQQTGNVLVALYASADAYSDGEREDGLKLVANQSLVSGTIAGLAPGIYAIKLFHDVNGDGKLDKNWAGIPSEPYGFSNDAPARFGPAKWEDAKFELNATAAEQTIHLSK